MTLFSAIQSELVLVIVAGLLFLLGVIDRPGARKLCAWIAVLTLAGIFCWQVWKSIGVSGGVIADPHGAFHSTPLTNYIRLLASGVGALLVLLAWPTDGTATSNSAINYGTKAGEFFAMMLLSIAGIFIVAGANDIIVLFLGIELASIPTYIMVSISRPVPVAQEAGIKYFFLGAMAAAILLFGFSYLYGVTGATNFRPIADYFAAANGNTSPWAMLAIVMIVVGLAFKLAAVPLHFYAGDVYQGAATPVTAFLSFVPKTSGMIALIKILFVIGGGTWPGVFHPQIAKLIWIMAVLTMFAGNLLGLLQHNVKRIFAYSSIAHSGYMLVGVAVMVGSSDRAIQLAALTAVLFYIASYGIISAAAFGVLILLPAKRPPAWDKSGVAYHRFAASAETLDDLAGAGIKNIGLGLAMAIACFSLTGLPLTVGFFGKFYLIQSAWRGGFTWLIILMMINAAISAGYYLRIVGTIFLRSSEPTDFDSREAERTPPIPVPNSFFAWPIVISIMISCFATLLFGAYFTATDTLNISSATAAAGVDPLLGQPVIDERAEHAPVQSDRAILAASKRAR